MLITNSMQKTWQRCHKSFEYKFVRNYVPNSPPLVLKRGKWLHELLEAHYVHGNWKKRHKQLTKEFNTLFEEEREMYGDLPGVCERIMEAYVYNYRKEDKGITVVAAEEVIEIPMPHGHTMQFKFDMILEDEYGVWLGEHKSHRNYPSAEYRFIDSQTAKYVWGLNKLKKYGKITGIWWNYLRTVPPTKPKLNKDGTLSKRKINTDLFTFVRALKEYGLDPSDYRDVLLRLKQGSTFFKRDRVPVTPDVSKTLVKEMVLVADEIERGVDAVRSVSPDCVRCPYMQPCLTSLYGGDEAMILKARFREGNAEDYYAFDSTLEEVV